MSLPFTMKSDGKLPTIEVVGSDGVTYVLQPVLAVFEIHEPGGKAPGQEFPLFTLKTQLAFATTRKGAE